MNLKFLNIYSLLITAGLSVFCFMNWLAAFFNGGTVLLTINDYGEMYPEIFVWIILLPIIVVGCWNNYKVIMDETYGKKKE